MVIGSKSVSSQTAYFHFDGKYHFETVSYDIRLTDDFLVKAIIHIFPLITTVWKLQIFFLCVTQILREIKIGEST